jgi:hypothetical protein
LFKAQTEMEKANKEEEKGKKANWTAYICYIDSFILYYEM